jgi:hypothetical protein
MKRQGEGNVWFGLVAMALLIAISGSASRVLAAPPNLPPRPTPEPTSVPGPPESKPRGGWIELRAREVNRSSIGSVVQWQDSLGEWHDVDSWRGEFDEVVYGVGTKTWWLDEWLFGAGPFRWVVYDQTSGQVLARTAPFTMPREHRQTVSVDAVSP